MTRVVIVNKKKIKAIIKLNKLIVLNKNKKIVVLKQIKANLERNVDKSFLER